MNADCRTSDRSVANRGGAPECPKPIRTMAVMTNQELRDFIAELSLSKAELRKSQEKTDKQIKETVKADLYLARIHDGEFELLTPKDFKPRASAAPPERNGE